MITEPFFFFYIIDRIPLMPLVYNMYQPVLDNGSHWKPVNYLWILNT